MSSAGMFGARLIVVTGATGYIGTAFVRRLRAGGFRVRSLSRSRPTDSDVEHIPYDLSNEIAPAALDGATAVVHLAAETGQNSAVHIDVELTALRRLMTATHRVGARLVFVSSQVATANAQSNYGRTKWLGEQEVRAGGGVIVRPGLVYGGAEGGQFGMFCRLLRRTHMIPVLLPAPLVQPVHVDDLATALLAAAIDPSLDGAELNVAEAQPVAFHTFLGALASARVRGPTILVPVPAGIVMALFAIGRPFVGSVADPDRLRSFLHLQRLDSTATLQRLSLSLRQVRNGLTRSGRARRRQLVEAKVLFAYLVGRPVPSAALRRYVKALRYLGEPAPLVLPGWIERCPAAMVVFDQPGIRARTPGHAFHRRLELATFLAETIPTRATSFIALGGPGRMARRLGGLAIRLAVESLVRAVVVVLGNVLARRLPSVAGDR